MKRLAGEVWTACGPPTCRNKVHYISKSVVKLAYYLERAVRQGEVLENALLLNGFAQQKLNEISGQKETLLFFNQGIDPGIEYLTSGIGHFEECPDLCMRLLSV